MLNMAQRFANLAVNRDINRSIQARHSNGHVFNPLAKIFTWQIMALLPIICTTSNMVFAESSVISTSSARANINIKIEVPVVVRVTAIKQIASINIEQIHVDRGYIDLDAASMLKLTSNSRHGYTVSVNFNSDMLESVEVKLPDRTLRVAANSTSMHVNSPILVDEIVGVSYRLYLKAGLRAGEYHWPVALAFSPNAGRGAC